MSSVQVSNGSDLISFKKLSKSKVADDDDDVWSNVAIANFEINVKLPDIFHHKTSNKIAYKTQQPSAHDEKMERRRLRQINRSIKEKNTD